MKAEAGFIKKTYKNGRNLEIREKLKLLRYEHTLRQEIGKA